ncbi:glutamate ABC transporter substrate-binding protein [Virgisporangium aurantiacum]|uniref:ABC transporter substrate-binding protein n=1 Tax=Virgisporangium aurantiacum TaxID=175570 RepID=A0A8J3ZHS7_9ACTN|nr:glutamate ABC transporter substrate-binding protein [Virgisporangium aurantiacum]GIJ61776.1 ABC transporter substrate-binding protein [Virgisporangium aurantiacum]
MKAIKAAAIAAVLLVAGCTAAQKPTDPADTTPVQPRPAGVQDPAVLPSAPPSTATCDPLASLRPGALPPPGQPPAGSTMARIAQRGRLIVGVSQNTYLFGHRDAKTGELVGFEVDLAKEVARALFGDPTKIQFRSMTAAERIPALMNGDVDLVVRAMTMTCDRWQQISFSTEYYTGGQRLLVPVDSPVKTIDDMGGKKVCAATGSTNITAIAAAKSKPIPVAAPDALDCMVLLQQGQIDAVSSDDAILAGFAAQDPATRVVGPAFAAAPYGIGIAKPNADLVRFVNGVLDKVRADGTWTAIYNRWLTTLGPAPAPPPARYQA